MKFDGEITVVRFSVMVLLWNIFITTNRYEQSLELNWFKHSSMNIKKSVYSDLVKFKKEEEFINLTIENYHIGLNQYFSTFVILRLNKE